VIRSLKELFRRELTLPSLPQVCLLLNESVNNPRTSTLQIAELIGSDAALTARLLKLVNSSFYGFPSRIETPSQAVMILGTAHLCDLAFTTAITRLFKDIPGDLVCMDSFWRHSIACGLAARVLASWRHEPNDERFFVAGVLHDIGRLVFYQQVPDLARRALIRCRMKRDLLYRAERSVIGFDHAMIGAALLHEWLLPQSLVESVAFHHDPLEAGRHPLEAALVHVGDVIAQAMHLGTSGERFVPPVSSRAWDLIDLPVTALPAVVEAVEGQFEEVTRAVLHELSDDELERSEVRAGRSALGHERHAAARNAPAAESKVPAAGHVVPAAGHVVPAAGRVIAS
jgi:putative nucleotidyltransferase with HDIG domain